jgi:hypothetical protein
MPHMYLPTLVQLEEGNDVLPVLTELSTAPRRHMTRGCIDQHLLDLGTRWRPLYSQGKSPRCPMARRLGGLQSRCGRYGDEQILDRS